MDAAPFTYVKVCDAYGAGFYTIPGTETCIKIGGRIRSDYVYVPTKDTYSALGKAGTPVSYAYAFSGAAGVAEASSATQVAANYQTNPTTASYATDKIAPYTGYWKKTSAVAGYGTGVVSQAADAQNVWGGEARGRIDIDARTPTAYGTVQAVLSTRVSRGYGVNGVAVGETKGHGSSPTMEAAYVRFAGFTFGSARDNFAFMPSLVYGAGHWASFGNGATQLAYTAVLGGGISATVALQNHGDTTAGIVGATTAGVIQPYDVTAAGTPMAALDGYKVASEVATITPYKSMPLLVANIGLTQGWGEVRLMGAFANLDAVSTQKSTNSNPLTVSYDKNKSVYAYGGGVKLDLSSVAAGDAIWLNGAWANGMTEYTVNYTSFKSSAFGRDVGGYTMNAPSAVAYNTGIETVKSWSLGAIGQHYWTPQVKSVAFVSYGKVLAPTTAKLGLWNGTTYFDDQTVFNAGKQISWSPTKDFEIGLEAIYSRVKQNVKGMDGTATAADANGVKMQGTAVTKSVSDNNWTGRLRIERNF